VVNNQALNQIKQFNDHQDKMVLRSSCTNPYAEIMALDDNPNIFFTSEKTEIDAVVTFVDGSCPEQQRNREVWWKALKNTPAADANTGNRFRNNGEIYFCIQGIRMFAPWIRKIFIVGSTHTQDPHIQGTIFIPHLSILPNDALPTFNSHAIEAALHKIPGLAEKFIYFNDDMVLIRHVKPSAFFTPDDNRPVIPLDYDRNTKHGTPQKSDVGFAAAWKNVNALLDVLFGTTHPYRVKLSHAPIPLKRSLIEEIYSMLPCKKLLQKTLYSRFRSLDDISSTCSLYPWYALYTDQAIAISGKNRNLTIFNVQTPQDFPDPYKISPLTISVCVEDSITDETKKNVLEYKEAYKRFFSILHMPRQT
jgi:Stealth protein CR2, conserved region 2/Stealth protein CR3, conserved region 3